MEPIFTMRSSELICATKKPAHSHRISLANIHDKDGLRRTGNKAIGRYDERKERVSEENECAPDTTAVGAKNVGNPAPGTGAHDMHDAETNEQTADKDAKGTSYETIRCTHVEVEHFRPWRRGRQHGRD